MNQTLRAALTVSTTISIIIFGQLPVFADSWDQVLDTEIRKRTEQGDLIPPVIKQILEAAEPTLKKLKENEEQAKPLLDEKQKTEKEEQVHAGNCHKDFNTNDSAQKQAYQNCLTEHKQIDEKYKGILTKLKPFADREQQYLTVWSPLNDKLEDLGKKWKANQKEIQRLEALKRICKISQDNCRDGACTQLELETWHLCESIPFDGTNPRRFDPKKFGYIAEIDPNLPPLDWKPENFKATPNK